MPRKYDVSLLESIKRGEEVVTYKNVSVLVKPIPEGGEPGDMDPRIYKSMKMLPLMKHFMPKATDNPIVVENLKNIKEDIAKIFE
ncbi:MAG: hypothetical protein ACI4E5_11530 [Suilimivivens sp.]